MPMKRTVLEHVFDNNKNKKSIIFVSARATL